MRDDRIQHGHISSLHKWWARRPLPICRAVVFASLVPDPLDENCPQAFQDAVEILLRRANNVSDPYKPYEDIPYTSAIDIMEDNLRNRLLMFIGKFSNECIKNEKVASEFPTIGEQEDVAIKLSEKFPQTVNYASTFSVKNFNDDSWIEETIERLKNSFSAGAIAVKVWKNVGMELKDSDDNFVMIDHPKFDAVFNFLTKNNIPLIGHLGEPKNCWLPIEQMTVQGDVNYFSLHPKYHMYLHPEYPSYVDQINARDRMLEKHLDLQFIGAHLGSLEWNVDELAKRLDKFPNMAVDTASRISHLQYQAKTNWQKVHDFCMKYQDRIIYGTDIIVHGTKDPVEMKKEAHDIRLRHWNFFTSDKTMLVPKVEGEFKGLKLPGKVVDKIYCKNAEKWFHGVLKKER